MCANSTTETREVKHPADGWIDRLVDRVYQERHGFAAAQVDSLRSAFQDCWDAALKTAPGYCLVECCCGCRRALGGPPSLIVGLREIGWRELEPGRWLSPDCELKGEV